MIRTREQHIPESSSIPRRFFATADAHGETRMFACPRIKSPKLCAKIAVVDAPGGREVTRMQTP